MIEKSAKRLRKKLRQIAYLETLSRSLNNEEASKVMQKTEIISQLHEIILADSKLSSQETNNVTFNPDVAKKEEVPAKNNKTIFLQEKYFVQETKNNSDFPLSKKINISGEMKEMNKSSLFNICKKVSYNLKQLHGHNDIILNLSISDNMLASASRDTLIKIWNIISGELIITLSGHSEAVNAVVLLDSTQSSAFYEQFKIPIGHNVCISGSQDCNIRLWHVQTGCELFSQYTFTPITALSWPQHNLCTFIVSGNSSGQLEIWDLCQRRLLLSTSEFSSLVSDIHARLIPAENTCDAKLEIVSSGECGVVKVHELVLGDLHHDFSGVAKGGDLNAATWRLVFQSDSVDLHDASREVRRRRQRLNLGQILSTAPLAMINTPSDCRILVGDDGATVKLIDRERGVYTKISNTLPVPPASSRYGRCDCICVLSSIDEKMNALALCSGVDLDTSNGFISLVDVPAHGNTNDACKRVGILRGRPDAPLGRVLTVAATNFSATASDGVLIVTGGCELYIWQPVLRREQIGRCAKTKLCQVEECISEKDGDTGSSCVSESDSETESDSDWHSNAHSGSSVPSSSTARSWWCLIM